MAKIKHNPQFFETKYGIIKAQRREQTDANGNPVYDIILQEGMELLKIASVGRRNFQKNSYLVKSHNIEDTVERFIEDYKETMGANKKKSEETVQRLRTHYGKKFMPPRNWRSSK